MDHKCDMSEGQKHLDADNIPLAFLIISAKVEEPIWTKLFFEKNIPLEKMEDWTLGKFINKGIDRGLFIEHVRPYMKRFRDARNMLVHNDVMTLVLETPTLKTQLKDLLQSMIHFSASHLRTVTPYNKKDQIRQDEYEREVQEELKRLSAILK